MVGPIRNNSTSSQGSNSNAPPAPASSTSSSAASRTPRRASCEFCRRRKIRCNGEEPCSACVQRKLVCVFERESPKGRPPRSSKPAGSSGLRDMHGSSGFDPDAELPPGSIPLATPEVSGRIMRPSKPLASFRGTQHSFDIRPEDIATPFWVQLGGRQGTIASALQDMWDRYFGPKENDSNRPSSSHGAAHQPVFSKEPFQSASDSHYTSTAQQEHNKETGRRDSRFPQTTLDSGEDEFHWVASFNSSIQLMVQGMIELSCNVYSQLGCTWIGKPFFFVHMMNIDPTRHMFDHEEPGPNPLDDLSLEEILGLVELFFSSHAMAALVSKSMLIDQCRLYKLGPVALINSSFSDLADGEQHNIPPPSPLLIATVLAEAIPESVEDEEDAQVVEAANAMRHRLKRYAESLLFSTTVEPRAISTTSAGGEVDHDHHYDLSAVQAVILIGTRELCEGTSPRKSACCVGVVARMLSHMRAKERAAPRKNSNHDAMSVGTTYRAVNDEIRINVEWLVTAISAWFFCQLERPLGSILPPASILRFPPLRISRSAAMQMDKRRKNFTTLRRQAQLVEQLWTCATVTVTVCLIHDLHPSSQEHDNHDKHADQTPLWQEERSKELQTLTRPKFNMLELCERIQRYLDDYLRDMAKNKAPPTALAYLEASFMAIYIHTLLPSMTPADVNWNTGNYFRKETFDSYIVACNRVLASLEPWASTSRTKSSYDMFSRTYEPVQKQLADIFVLALDSCQQALRVIVDYLSEQTPFTEGQEQPARTATGWLMPRAEVVHYMRKKIPSILTLAEQFQLASGSSFLRVGLHARRVEEGFTHSLGALREMVKERDAVPGPSVFGHRLSNTPSLTPPTIDQDSMPSPARSARSVRPGSSSSAQHMEDLFGAGPSVSGSFGMTSSVPHSAHGGPTTGTHDLTSTLLGPSPPFAGSARGSTSSTTHQSGYTPVETSLSTMWWDQQASAMPFSFANMAGDMPGGSGLMNTLPPTSSAGSGQGGAVAMDISGHGLPSHGGIGNDTSVPMDTSPWGSAATIPDTWLAAAFYDNMEVLRNSGFTTG
ncbi:hypothetical protein OC861_003258 [Tilletia horrida]|nr:hypothetical protein OC861_003258 [Tilletia horrida]